jgi:hypothetical protein
MCAKKSENALTVLDQADYPALNPADPRVQLMVANLGGEALSVADFNRIKVPTQGGTKWIVEGAAGAEILETIEGVILNTTRRRAYWPNPNPSEIPPDCSSDDMKRGVGNPGGDCLACPFNQFGSAPNGRGKACKEVRMMFLLRKGNVLPDVVGAPPASLKNARKYLMALSQAGMPYWAVVTQLGLVGDKNADGTAYAKVTERMVGQLDPESQKAILETIRRYEETFKHVTVAAADVAGGDTEEI